MRDYSSAKIELMALKWAVCEKFKDYLLGSKFTVYTDNNPIVHIQKSKLGAAQIRWLSELALYDFDIIYRTGRIPILLLMHSVEDLKIPILTKKALMMKKSGLPFHSKQFVKSLDLGIGGTKVDHVTEGLLTSNRCCSYGIR